MIANGSLEQAETSKASVTMDEDTKRNPKSIARQVTDLVKNLQDLRDICRRRGERYLGFANAIEEGIEPVQRAGTVYSIENLERLQQLAPELYRIVDQAVTTAGSLSRVSVEKERSYELTQFQMTSTTSSVAASATSVVDLAFTVSERLEIPVLVTFQHGSLDRIQSDPARVELLAQVEQHGKQFRGILVGCWQTYYSNNPDRFRQAAVSMRELVRMMLDTLAPRAKVALEYGLQPAKQPDGSVKSPEAQVTHAMQIKFAMRDAPEIFVTNAKVLAEVLQGLERGAYGALNVPVHTSLQEGSSTTHALLSSGEALLRLLLTYARKQ